MEEFLHSHPAIELGLKLSTEHVIIERKDWEAAKNMLQTDRVGRIAHPNWREWANKQGYTPMYFGGVDPVDPWVESAREFAYACTFGAPQPAYKPSTLKPWKVTVRLKPEQRFNGKYICTVEGKLREVPEPYVAIYTISYDAGLKIFKESEIMDMKIERDKL